MINRVILIFCLLTAIYSCDKEDSSPDYREQFIGTYDCTKSTRSFEDDLFASEIDDIIIELDSSSDSLIIINGVKLTLNPDGTTGRVSTVGDIYDLSIDGNSMKLLTNPDVSGFFVYCYIKGVKI